MTLENRIRAVQGSAPDVVGGVMLWIGDDGVFRVGLVSKSTPAILGSVIETSIDADYALMICRNKAATLQAQHDASERDKEIERETNDVQRFNAATAQEGI